MKKTTKDKTAEKKLELIKEITRSLDQVRGGGCCVGGNCVTKPTRVNRGAGDQ